MSALQELASSLTDGSRVILIAEKDVDLRAAAPDNRLFLLKVAEGSLAAGGRGGGFGERRVVRAALFELKSGSWSKVFDEGGPRAGEFEVPYYVSRLPFVLPDGKEAVGYGVVDPELLGQMKSKASQGSSA